METITTENVSYTVIGTGSVSASKNEPVTVEMTTTQGGSVKIMFNFCEDPNRGNDVDTHPSEDNSYLVVKIYNAEGAGSTRTPLDIGVNGETGKAIYLSFSFQQIKDLFVLQYTVMENK